jgi:tetratricopeptide (TPR) repeat protein
MPKQQRHDKSKTARTSNLKGSSRSRKVAGARPRGVDPGPAVVAVKPMAPAPPPVPDRKPRFHEAVARYEGAVRLLQRHEFSSAADQFRSVIAGYPEERELLERARLYLRVCERETSRQPAAGPRTPEERVYAATMALNAGELQTALGYLRQALQDNPELDHGHYIMSVALLEAGDTGGALVHLQNAVRLNPDNVSLARQDPDLEGLRASAEFNAVITSVPLRRAPSQTDRKLRRR